MLGTNYILLRNSSHGRFLFLFSTLNNAKLLRLDPVMYSVFDGSPVLQQNAATNDGMKQHLGPTEAATAAEVAAGKQRGHWAVASVTTPTAANASTAKIIFYEQCTTSLVTNFIMNVESRMSHLGRLE